MRITLPDDLGDHFEREADRLRIPVADVITRRLTASKAVGLDERVIVLSGKDRVVLERRAKRAFRTSADLMAYIDLLAEIEIGHVRIEPTPKQLEEVRRRADKRGVGVETILGEIAAGVEMQFFESLGMGGVAVPAEQSARGIEEAAAKERVHSPAAPGFLGRLAGVLGPGQG